MLVCLQIFNRNCVRANQKIIQISYKNIKIIKEIAFYNINLAAS
jgi:hypothetical protein